MYLMIFFLISLSLPVKQEHRKARPMENAPPPPQQSLQSRVKVTNANVGEFAETSASFSSLTLSSCLHTEYVAMYTYESNEQGDLSFQQGDIVVVTRKEGDWWTGMVGGKTGVFPSNYVKPRDSTSEVRAHFEQIRGRIEDLQVNISNHCDSESLPTVTGNSREDGKPWEETR